MLCFPGSFCATTAGPELSHLLFQRSPKPKCRDVHTVRFDFIDGGDRELPLNVPRTDAGAARLKRLRSIRPRIQGDSTLARSRSVAVPYVVSSVDAGKSVTFKPRSDLLGPLRCRYQSRPVEFRDELHGLISIVTPTPISKRSKAGLYDVRGRDRSPALAKPASYPFPCGKTTWPRRFKEAFPAACRSSLRFRLQYTRRPIFCRHPCPPGDCAAVRFFCGSQPQFLLQPVPAGASYFWTTSNSSAYHRPADAEERTLLAPYPGAVEPDVLDGTWSPPVSDRSRPRSQYAPASHARIAGRAAGYEARAAQPCAIRPRTAHSVSRSPHGDGPR